MASFDEIKDKLSQTGQDAVKKAKEFADITRLNASAYAEERIKNNLFQEIGRICYKDNKDNPDEKYTELFSAVAESDEKISDLKEQVRKIKKIVICPKCGEECPAGAAYCHKCGASIPAADEKEKSADEESGEVIYCSGCGAAMPTGSVICTNCGEKLL